MARIPQKFNALLSSKSLAHIATIMTDGSPQVTPVWFDYDGEYIRINTAVGRLKDRNVRRDPRVAVSITDIDEPETALCVRGTVIEITEDPDLIHMNALTRKYRGDEWQRVPGQVRVVYKIRADTIAGE
jgi:PPOX class probable F420-dependent enzyme